MKEDMIMEADIRFDREIWMEEGYCIVLGGYEMRIGGKDFSFDFRNCDMEVDEDDPTVLHCVMYRLNTLHSPESEPLNHAEGSVEKVQAFIVYTGDEDEPEISPLELLSLSLYRGNGDMIPVTDGALEGVLF